jgi:glutamate-1-semialdehyde 2,1-aminomutase
MASEALGGAGVPHRLSFAGNLFSIFFTDAPVTNFAQAKTQDVGAFKAFFHAMLEGGVYLPPSAFEAWFVSTAIDDEALDAIAAALPSAARAAAAAQEGAAAARPAAAGSMGTA